MSSNHAMESSAACTLVVVPTEPRSGPTWVLLHGSDGSEADLLPVAERLAPSAVKVAPRGTVETPEGFAFFLRGADRRIDEADLRVRAEPLVTRIRSAQAAHASDGRLVVLGFSNGAVMATALIELHPELFAAAVLVRTQLPFPGVPRPAVPSIPVLVLDGRDDARRSPEAGRDVARRLRDAGARVTHVVLPVAHGMTAADERRIANWLAWEQR
ncbi:alpha/beta hydrolase [Curtobacterium sp. MCBA15_001]|uniref:alpha/beta hydrolase n=1 Tax=Curtobacterium sp. MCBA15_001 TaxID=1898731 RepID=UPI0011141925|nr:alpha/beta hydrolase [Curtobacterium sp. MCBA15_001]